MWAPLDMFYFYFWNDLHSVVEIIWCEKNMCFASAGARGSVLPGALPVSHGAGEGGGHGGRHQEGHPSGPTHLLLYILLTRWGGTGGGNEEVKMQVFRSLWLSCFDLVVLALPFSSLRGEQLSNIQAINKVCSSWTFRLGYTYLRLKDNHMEILNKEDEIERLVLATELGLVQQPWREKKKRLIFSDITV